MKRNIIMIILLILTAFLFAQDEWDKKIKKAPTRSIFSLSAGGGVKSLALDRAKDVYGDFNPVFYLDFAVNVAKPLELFFHIEYFNPAGELSYTKEETKLRIIPVELGLRFLISKGNFTPYIGGGVGYYFYQEENVIGKLSDNKIGFLGEAGFKIFIAKKFFIDIKGRYTFLKVNVQQEEESIDLSGLSILGGFGITF